jgi:hypothetical protein
MGILVICSYKAKPGKEGALRALVLEHLPALQRLGLATLRAGTTMEGQGGHILEVFEWASEEQSRNAQSNPEVAALWRRFAEISDFVPLASLAEAKKPFAHFAPFER